MDKDAYYFPHFSNARHDRKLKRVRKELGVEGYGIYFMLLEVLRDQEEFKYPIEDLDLLADEFGTSEQKVRTVICNYQLFQVDERENFFSLKFVKYLQPYLDNKHRNRINGIKGNLVRYNYLTKEEADSMSDMELLELNDHRKQLIMLPSNEVIGGDSGGEQPSDRKESKEKKRNNKKDIDDFFESCWINYPRKEGKGKISNTKKQEAFELGYQFEICIARYNAKIKKDKTEPKYIMQGSTFWNSGYVDYLDSSQDVKEIKPIVFVERDVYD
jgi:hypothetical protein